MQFGFFLLFAVVFREPARVDCSSSAAPLISGINNTFSWLSEVNKSCEELLLSTKVISEIVPFNETDRIFALQSVPDLGLLVKLTDSLNFRTEKFKSMTHMGMKFSHYDEISEKMFKYSFESLLNLTRLHKSVPIPGIAYYQQILICITNFTEAIVDFLVKFKSTLVIERFNQVPAFSECVLDYVNLDASFHAITFILVNAESTSSLIEMIFSSVSKDQNEIWKRFRDFSSPAICIPFPFEFLRKHDAQVSIFELCCEVLSKTSTSDESRLNSAWFKQLGLMARFHLLTHQEILYLAARISELAGDTICLDENVYEFFRLTFQDLNSLPVSKTPQTLNFVSKITTGNDPLFLENYYKELWSLTIKKISFCDNFDESNFSELYVLVQKALEVNFPGISQELDTENMAIVLNNPDWSFSLYKEQLKEFIIDLSTPEAIQRTLDFVQSKLDTEMIDSTFRETRETLDLILRKLLEITEIILISSSSDLSELTDAVAASLTSLLEVSELCPKVTCTAEISSIVRLAFKLDEISIAGGLLEFLLKRIDQELLVCFLLDVFVLELKIRPDFFCLHFCGDSFSKIDNLNLILESHLLNEISEIQVTSGTLRFLEKMFNESLLSQEWLGIFLEKVLESNAIEFESSVEFSNFLSTVTDIGCISFKHDDSNEFLALKLHHVRQNTLKILHLILASPILIEIHHIVHWILTRIVLLEDLKPEIQSKSQLNSLNLSTSKLTPESATRTSLSLIEIFLKRGASVQDLKKANIFCSLLFDLITKSFTDSTIVLKKHSSSTCFALMLFIIRADNSRVSTDFAIRVMKMIGLGPVRVSIPQLIYKAYKAPENRAVLFPALIDCSFDMVDFGYLHDPHIFDGMTSKIIEKLLLPVIEASFVANTIEKFHIDALAFWISYGLVPSKLVCLILDNFATKLRCRFAVVRFSISILRAIFKRSEYMSLRKLAVDSLLTGFDHAVVTPKPFSLGIIAGVADLVPEMIFPTTDVSYMDSQAILERELKRFNQARDIQPSLNPADGIQLAMDSFMKCSIELCEYRMNFARKQKVLSSISYNLSHLNSIAAHTDAINEEFALEQVDHFVRIMLLVMSQIQTDLVGPVAYGYEMDADSIDSIISVIVRFIRDSHDQCYFILIIVNSLKGSATSRKALLQSIPRYISWKRFLLTEEFFKVIFNLNPEPEEFKDFMNEVIDAVFKFDEKPLFPEAEDLTRTPEQHDLVHERFFYVMTDLYTNYNLPIIYILRIMSAINDNCDRIEVLSPSLVGFFLAILQKRTINHGSLAYSLTAQVYGDSIYHNDSYLEVASDSVLYFLANRPDFIALAFISSSGSDATKLMKQLHTLTARRNPIFKTPPIQLLWAMFQEIIHLPDVIKFLPAVQLSEACVRQLCFCIVNYAAKTSSLPEELAIASLLTVIGAIPENLSLDSFTTHDSAPSWFKVSPLMLDWISKTLEKYPQLTALSINATEISKLFAFLTFNCRQDGKEDAVSKLFLNFMEAMCSASEDLQYSTIKLMSSTRFSPFIRVIRNTKGSVFVEFASRLRRWILKSPSITRELAKLIHSINPGSEREFSEEEIMAQRTSFVKDLEALKEDRILTNTLDSFKTIFLGIIELRQMMEIDLILKFIKTLHEIVKKFYPRPVSVNLNKLAHSIASSILVVPEELLLQENSSIFVDIFKFIHKHSPSRSSDTHFYVLDIILPQIRSSTDISRVFASAASDLSLEACQIPQKGFPEHFYADKELVGIFFDSYLDRIGVLSIANQGISRFDVTHLVLLFNVLYKSNTVDEAPFNKWLRAYSKVLDNDVVTEEFIENLKAHCVKSKQFCKDLMPSFLNSALVGKTLNYSNDQMLPKSLKDNLIAIFSFMSKIDPLNFKRHTDKLPIDIKKPLLALLTDSVAEAKQKLILSILERCKLPENDFFNYLEYLDITESLFSLMKIDLNLLPESVLDSFFVRLDRLTNTLSNHLGLSSLSQIIGICTTGLALQIKYNRVPQKIDVVLVLRAHMLDNTPIEVLSIVTNFLADYQNFEYSDFDCISFVRLLARIPQSDEILVKALKNPLMKPWTLKIVIALIEYHASFETAPLVLQMVFCEQFSEFASQQEISFSDYNSGNLNILLQLGKSNNLFTKSQLLLIEGYLVE